MVDRGVAFPVFWLLLDPKGPSHPSERSNLMERFLTLFGPDSIPGRFADRACIGVEGLR